MRLFGTDGIRGRVNQHPITADIAMKFGMAAGVSLRNGSHRNRVIIAKDTRLSGYLLEPALTAGFISVGVDVILVGPMPTPAVPALIRSLRADFGVMISASHNPHYDNGMKLFDALGNKLSDKAQNKVEQLIVNNTLDKYLVPPEELGRAKRLEDAPGRYVEFVKATFPKNFTLEGKRIVIDCANGAAYNLAPAILWELGAEVIKLGCEPDGFNINKDCGAMHPESLGEKVVENKGDIGIALDGDADRVLICDEKGKPVHGDQILAAIADYLVSEQTLKGDGVVITQMSNQGLEDYLIKKGLKVLRTKVGDRYVAEAMRSSGCNFGGEQSGHIILGDYASTGDGIAAALQILALLCYKGIKASELHSTFKSYPQVTESITYLDTNPLLNATIQAKLEELTEKYKDKARVLVRSSGTEKVIRVMVESYNEVLINSLVTKIKSIFAG